MMITIFASSSAVCVNVYMHLYLKKKKEKTPNAEQSLMFRANLFCIRLDFTGLNRQNQYNYVQKSSSFDHCWDRLTITTSGQDILTNKDIFVCFHTADKPPPWL